MKRPLIIQDEVQQVGVVSDLTSVFEGIASLRIARIKDKVVQSKEFFAELWHIYTQLHQNNSQMLAAGPHKNKDMFVVISSEGGLSGDIDNRIIDRAKSEYNPETTEVMVLGSHGATLLAQAGIPIVGGYRLPDTDATIDTSGIIANVRQYRNASVFYQTYESLGVQAVAKIDLVSAARKLGEGLKPGEEVISSHEYIFEPSIDEILAYMESVVVGLTLGQAILESRLAQYASRYNAMSVAKRRARDLDNALLKEFRQAKRAESDERLKETLVALRGFYE